MGQLYMTSPGAMRAHTQVFASAPGGLVELLKARLPTSLTILRRLQFAARAAPPSPTGRVIFVSDREPTSDEASPKPSKFTVLYGDFSDSTETQMFMYSTLEDKPLAEHTAEDRAEYEEQLLAVVDELIHLRNGFDPEGKYPTTLLLGSLHADVRAILEKTGRVLPRPTGAYDKWLFRVEDLPRAESPLPDGMHWGHASFSDCEIVVSRTDIPRTAATLSKLPSSLIRLEDGTPIAWAFLGLDGSLISVHCEDGHRRMGLAKRVAGRLLRENAEELAPDGWSCADVSADNVASRAMCKSLNGKPNWVVSWILLELAETVRA